MMGCDATSECNEDEYSIRDTSRFFLLAISTRSFSSRRTNALAALYHSQLVSGLYITLSSQEQGCIRRSWYEVSGVGSSSTVHSCRMVMVDRTYYPLTHSSIRPSLEQLLCKSELQHAYLVHLYDLVTSSSMWARRPSKQLQHVERLPSGSIRHKNDRVRTVQLLHKVKSLLFLLSEYTKL